MMRYLELLEYEDGTQVPTEPNAAVEAQPEGPTRDFFHVTTKHRLRSIEANGIVPNRNRRWKTAFGQALGERGKIYLMSDFTSAVRWAYKMQWEHFQGKKNAPSKSPYIILKVRENPAELEPDPHPENGLYGNSWFQKSGSIDPSNIVKVIPLTSDLTRQVATTGKAVLEGLTSTYSPARAMRELRAKGWEMTNTPQEYKNTEYPELSVDLDVNSPLGGPFTVFYRNRKIGVFRSLPTAQQLGMKYGLTMKPREADPVDDGWL
jgi:hypothetical protein